MMSNPYQPTADPSVTIVAVRASRTIWAVVGFAVMSLPLIGLGVYGLYVDAQYAATLPPNTPRCGNGVLAALFFIVIAGPAMGTLGACGGFLCATVRNAKIGRREAKVGTSH